MAYSRVQSKLGLTGSATFDSSITAGNLVVVGVTTFGTDPGVSDVTDNKGNTYTRVNHQGPALGAENFQAIYYTKVATGGSSFTITNALGDTIMIAEYSGNDATSPLDQTSSGSLGNSSTPTAASITPSMNGCLIFAVAWSVNHNDTWGAGGSFSLVQNNIDNSTYERGAIIDYIQPTAGAISAGFTTSGSGEWGALSASFKPASSGASTSDFFQMF